MSESEPEAVSNDLTLAKGHLDTVVRFAPASALGVAVLYALGLYTAFSMDATLGIGSIEVSRERAVCLGMLQLVLGIPSIVFWLCVEESEAELSDPSFWKRLRVSGRCLILPILFGFFLGFALSFAFYVERRETLGIHLYFPILLALFLILNSKSNARRLVKAWPIFSVVLLAIQPPFLAVWLPMEFGGHAGKSIRVIFKDKTSVSGTLRMSDSKILVLETERGVTAISRDEVHSVESQTKLPMRTAD